jgi:predicted negative regulator of RcsB-dependent stress response
VTGNKQAQKELKRPDKFQIELMQIADWIAKHRKQLLNFALLPIASIIAVGLTYQKVQEHRTETRADELSKIDVVFEKENEAADKQRKLIQEKMAKLVEAPKPAGGEANSPEKVANPEEAASKPVAVVLDPKAVEAETKKFEAELKLIKPDHTESLVSYQKYFDANASNPEGWRAGMRAVNIQVELRKYSDAALTAERLLKQALALDFYQVQVRMLYVSILEELDRYDDALKELDLLTKLADEALQPKVLLTKGRIEILKNNKTAAHTTFEGLIAKHAASAEAQKAKTIMALWN